ncbi:hypothetical protein BC739_003118 [Kutzneria viridogrisea]|uniref:Uncharacterized protein n=1 Tax=Kutzneria viridogrisea TaxID=47990 RepID=A0ABR6BGA0_9PSEU|nr:hypothetical protein [Kutzneria viridogrisea]
MAVRPRGVVHGGEVLVTVVIAVVYVVDRVGPRLPAQVADAAVSGEDPRTDR